MSRPYSTLIMGASYGSLLAAKLMLAGHSVKLACLPEEAELINREGFRVRLPVRGREAPIELDSRDLPGAVSADTPDRIDPGKFDLVALAMQEPQYRAAAVRGLLSQVAALKLPCMSIMNMPPLPYLARIPGLSIAELKPCYTDPSVWDGFDPGCVTLASPDPQAFRPPEEPVNVLQVGLPTNFKVSRFASEKHTAILHQMAADIDAARFDAPEGPIELPVKLRVHDSLFVPMAKWSMLLTGNYRSIQPDGVRSIRDAVHGDLERSRAVYEWVGEVCKALGASEADLVPFQKYADAAKGLQKPSSAARAVNGGARDIERVDCLVKRVAAQLGMQSPLIDEIAAVVDARLEGNRKES